MQAGLKGKKFWILIRERIQLAKQKLIVGGKMQLKYVQLLPSVGDKEFLPSWAKLLE